jgi:hypothetical protein
MVSGVEAAPSAYACSRAIHIGKLALLRRDDVSGRGHTGRARETQDALFL